MAIVEPLAVAKILKGIVDAEQPGLVILGKQAIDDDSNQTGQMLAALLGWSQATFASKLEVDGSDFKVTREVDGGLQTAEGQRPGRRYHRSASQRAALRQPAQHHEGEEEAARDKTEALGVDIAPRLRSSAAEPSMRKAGVLVADVTELIDKPRSEAKVI